jgi:hypothetical protein
VFRNLPTVKQLNFNYTSSHSTNGEHSGVFAKDKNFSLLATLCCSFYENFRFVEQISQVAEGGGGGAREG